MHTWCAYAQDGSILLDGIDVRDLKQSSLRGAVAVVPQDTVLFADTILRNIRYGRPSASFEDIDKAAGGFMLTLFLYVIVGNHKKFCHLPEISMCTSTVYRLNLNARCPSRLACAQKWRN
jgi:hypothetical protein